MTEAALIELDGVDGSHWILSGPGYGSEGVEFATSPSGIYDAPVTVPWNSSAYQPGATPGHPTWLKRDVTFSVNIFRTEYNSWQEVDSAWRKAWSYLQDSTLSITTESGTRRLKLRMTQQPEFKPANDPHIKQWGRITMMCTAGVPWWTEDDVIGTDETVTDTTSSGTETLWVPVENPTDQELYLRWVLPAASANTQWTVPDFSWKDDENANRAIELPTQTTGQHLTIDTDPMEEMIVCADGSQFWARMNGRMFEFPVPAYTPRTLLPVQVSGVPVGTKVMVRCPRNWSRPWGLF